MGKEFTSTESVMLYAQRLVTRYVKHYVSDWLKYDAERAAEYIESEKPFFLIVRDCGTYVIPTQNRMAYQNEILDYYRTHDNTARYYRFIPNDRKWNVVYIK